MKKLLVHVAALLLFPTAGTVFGLPLSLALVRIARHPLAAFLSGMTAGLVGFFSAVVLAVRCFQYLGGRMNWLLIAAVVAFCLWNDLRRIAGSSGEARSLEGGHALASAVGTVSAAVLLL